MLVEILLTIVVVLLLILVYRSLKNMDQAAQGLELALSRAWGELQLDEKLGRFETYARDIRDDYRALEQMLRVPKERSDLSETALEAILADQLPEGLYGIRKRILNGRIPDAYIRSPIGLICIDSKFPLDNYRRMLEATSPTEAMPFKRLFISNVKEHLLKIARDYVCPEEGSAEFAFAYIHSEGVYWFLITEAAPMLRDFTRQGVQVVSPLTLSHKVELIKANLFAKRLTDEAEQIRTEIGRIAYGFSQLEREWRVMYQTHFRHLSNSMHRVDESYRKLGEEFGEIGRLSEEDPRWWKKDER
jgi:DNA recombination protein RmuC